MGITLVFKMTELGDPSNGFRRRVTTPSFCFQWIKVATPCRMDCHEPWAEAEDQTRHLKNSGKKRLNQNITVKAEKTVGFWMYFESRTKRFG